MTVLEAKVLLYNHFSSKPVFTFKENFLDVVTVSDTPEITKKIVELALNDLIKSEIVRITSTDDIDIYVLNQPLEHYPQTIVLNHATCSAIVTVLTEASDQYKSKDLIPNPLGISERDIQNVLILLQNSLKK